MSANETDTPMDVIGTAAGKDGLRADTSSTNRTGARRNKRIHAVLTTISDSAVEMRVCDRKTFENLVRDQIQIHESHAASAANSVSGSASVVAELLVAAEREETNAEVDAAFDEIELTPVWERETVVESSENTPKSSRFSELPEFSASLDSSGNAQSAESVENLDDSVASEFPGLSPSPESPVRSESREWPESAVLPERQTFNDDDGNDPAERDTLKPVRPGDESAIQFSESEVASDILPLPGLSETLEPEDEEIVLSDNELVGLVETGKALLAVAGGTDIDTKDTVDASDNSVDVRIGPDESVAVLRALEIAEDLPIRSSTVDSRPTQEASVTAAATDSEGSSIEGIDPVDESGYVTIERLSDGTDIAVAQSQATNSSLSVDAVTGPPLSGQVLSGHRSVIWEKHDAGVLLQSIRTSLPPPPEKQSVVRARNRWRALAIAAILVVMAMGGWMVAGMNADQREGILKLFLTGGDEVHHPQVSGDIVGVAPMRAKEHISVATRESSEGSSGTSPVGHDVAVVPTAGDDVVRSTGDNNSGEPRKHRSGRQEHRIEPAASADTPDSDKVSTQNDGFKKDRPHDHGALSSLASNPANDVVKGSVEKVQAPYENNASGEMPVRPSERAVRSAMAKVAPMVQSCPRDVSGKMIVQMVVSGASGKVVSSEVIDSTFKGTATGLCAVRAVQRVKLPAFKKEKIIIKYPFAL
jgi:hypothetical protein